jgi:hypothetical protein
MILGSAASESACLQQGIICSTNRDHVLVGMHLDTMYSVAAHEYHTDWGAASTADLLQAVSNNLLRKIFCVKDKTLDVLIRCKLSASLEKNART